MLLNVEVTAELIDRFRSDLVAAGFFVDNLEALWGPDAAAALHRSHRVPALRAIASSGSDDSALAVLARVFVLGLPVSARLFQSAIPSLGLRGATDLGLVSAQTDMVAPLLDVRPYSFHDSHGEGSWWIASDLGEMALGHAIDERHVLGVGGASLTLAGLMVNSEVSSVLDVGTGCGILALHASRFAERVVATDISPRALEIAALNAALNSISSIEFRLGSLFEPVDGERFDRIVSNPPFVITPRAEGVPRYEYRDGGLEGDAIVERVIRGVEDHLNPGGIAQLLGNWEYREATNAFERVGGWLENTGLDAWVVEREVQVPAVGFGYVNLRLPATGDRPWRSLERMDGALGSTFSSTTPGLGAHIEASFAARDWLEGIDDEMLGRSLLTVAPDVTEERHYWPGDDDPTVITLRQGAAFAREVPAGTLIAAVVGACDGDLSVRAICAAVADVLELDEAAVITEVLPSIRELVLWGLLSPESA
jgi:SAM-dependent methyltransferase